MMENKYRKGMTLFLERLGSEHQRYADALILQARLLKNIEDTNKFGETEARRAEWAQIVNTLNQLALSTMEVSFNELCEEAPSQRKRTSTLARCAVRIGAWIFKAEVMVIAIVLLVTGVVLWSTGVRSVVEHWTGVWFATPTFTPTVRLADASVSFIVTSTTGELEVPAGDTLPLAPGDRVLIGVNVTLDHLQFPRDLTYQYFALGGSIPEELTGPNVSYAAPEKPGTDIISVRIRDQETGDEIIRTINIEVKEQPP